MLVPRGCIVLIANWARWLPVQLGQRFLINDKRHGLVLVSVSRIEHNGVLWGQVQGLHKHTLKILVPFEQPSIVGRVIQLFSA